MGPSTPDEITQLELHTKASHTIFFYYLTITYCSFKLLESKANGRKTDFVHFKMFNISMLTECSKVETFHFKLNPKSTWKIILEL